jgi:hypothetical protein
MDDKGMDEEPFDAHLLAAAWVRGMWLKALAAAAVEMRELADDLKEKASGLD